MKRIIFVLILALALLFASCSDFDFREDDPIHGYTIITIDSVDYVVVYGGYGPTGICPKVK